MKYAALTIDTSIFHRYGRSLDTEPLKSLEQFKSLPVGLVLVDVVVQELRNHLTKKIVDQVKLVNKIVRTVSSLDIEPSLVRAIRE